MNDGAVYSIRDQALAHLRMLARAGFAVLPAAEAPAAAGQPSAPPQAEQAPEVSPASDSSAAQGLSIAAPAERLRAIAAEIAQCRRCALCKGRRNTVPGEGSPAAKLVFVGEAPGYDEDQAGRPFVGRAGQLLDRMIVAMRFRREDVFICNVVKCRPPDNRDPLPEEIRACEDYLLRQLDALQPAVIVTLGRYAAQCLLNTSEGIMRLRGQWREYHGIRLMPTFHPAFLLRFPENKRACWQDLQKAMAYYEEAVGPLPLAGA